MRHISPLSVLLASLTLCGSAIAQAPPPPPPVHHSLLGRIFHRPGQPAQNPGMMQRPGMMTGHMMQRPGMTAMSGGIIGNKNSHVYHMPGDRGSLPSPQNRVYFRTEAQAMAAGYHRSGSGATSHSTHH